MRKIILAAVAVASIFGAAPALADHDYRYRDRGISQQERESIARERTHRAWERNSERLYAETRRAWARNDARRAREAARRDEDHAYDDYAYRGSRRDGERDFLRFADRNHDGRVSHREYAWARARY